MNYKASNVVLNAHETFISRFRIWMQRIYYTTLPYIQHVGIALKQSKFEYYQIEIVHDSTQTYSNTLLELFLMLYIGLALWPLN